MEINIKMEIHEVEKNGQKEKLIKAIPKSEEERKPCEGRQVCVLHDSMCEQMNAVVKRMDKVIAIGNDLKWIKSLSKIAIAFCIALFIALIPISWKAVTYMNELTKTDTSTVTTSTQNKSVIKDLEDKIDGMSGILIETNTLVRAHISDEKEHSKKIILKEEFGDHW